MHFVAFDLMPSIAVSTFTQPVLVVPNHTRSCMYVPDLGTTGEMDSAVTGLMDEGWLGHKDRESLGARGSFTRGS